MKRILKSIVSISLCIVMLLTVFPMADITFFASAEVVGSGKCGNNLTWTLDSDGKLTIEGTGAMFDYSDFQYNFYNTSPREIIIGEGVTSIGDMAFFCCEELIKVTISDTVTRIGSGAFSNCRKLTDITISDSVAIIEDYAFELCYRLKNITIPSGVEYIEKDAFFGCGITSITFYGLRTQLENSDTIPSDVVIYGYEGSEVQKYAEENRIEFVSIVCDHMNTTEYGDVSADCINDGATSGIYCEDCKNWISGHEVIERLRHTDENADGICETCGESSYVEEGICGDDLTWKITENNTLIIEGKGDMYDYSFHEAPWSCYADEIVEIVIADTVTSIGECAFFSCQSITDVKIPYSVTSIGNYAFYICFALESIIFCNPETWFYYDSTTIDNDIVIYGYEGSTAQDYAEKYGREFVIFVCDHINTTEHEETPADCVNDGSTAGVYCEDCYKWISGHEVIEKTGHTDADADGVCEICGKSSYIAEGVCGDNLTWTLDSDGKLTIEGTGEMYDYDNLEPPWRSLTCKSAVLSQGITSIGWYAFYCCDDLMSITIPVSVTSIGGGAFEACDSLTSITFLNPETQIYNSSYTIPTTTVIYGYEGSTAQDYAGKYGREFVIFVCDHINTTEHEETPADCINDGVSAGVYCEDCNNWISGHEVIEKAGHTDEDDDGICETCGKSSYVASGVCGDNLTWRLTDNGTLAIDGTGNMYNYSFGEAPWYDYGHEIHEVVLDDSMTSIGAHSFVYCIYLASIEIPDSVTSIGEGAFSWSGLNSITIPDSVTSIGDGAFSATKLKSITIPDGITSIGESTFYSCSLESINIPDSVTSIGDSAFLFCTKLKNVTIPDGVTNIGDDVFHGCNSLTSITIPDSVTSIGDNAFNGCYALTSIVIPGSVTSIGAWAFSACNSITFHNSETLIYDHFDTIGADVIYGYEGSTAQAYAEKYGREFVAIDGAETHNHSYISEITTQPTCDKTGTKTFTCSCGDSYTEAVAALGHSFSTAFTVDKEATCTAEGSKSKHCTRSGCTAKTEVTAIAKLAHTYTSKITAQPTCAKEGIKTFTCSCGDSYTEAIAKLAHAYTSKITAQPTCDKEGTKTFTCSCGDSYTESVAALGHSFSTSFTVDKEATCTAEGSKSKHCTRSGCSEKTEVTAIAKLAHTYTSKITAQPTCAKEGVKTFTCVCGNSYTEAIAKLEHKYTSKITTQPTCAKEGVKTFTCSCGDSYTEAIAKLATHTWGEWKVTKAATYEAEGREERSCSVCKKTEGRAIPKLEYKEIEIPSTEEVKPLGEDAVLVLSDASVGEIIKNTKGNVSVTDKDGKAVSEKDSVASGMTVTLKDASGKVIDEKTIVVPGDNNGDGKITAADARTTLRASVSLDTLNTWQTSASNVDKTAENKITAADARFILRASVGLEKFSEWMKAVK